MKIKKIILFGSWATGKANEDSDIDLIIVSDDFEKMKSFKRVALMYDYWKSLIPVDFICYTPKEFEALRRKISLVREALQEGLLF